MCSPAVHDLAIKLATLEERMNTIKAETATGFEKLSKELAERDKSNTRWLIGVIVVTGLFITAILALVIRFLILGTG